MLDCVVFACSSLFLLLLFEEQALLITLPTGPKFGVHFSVAEDRRVSIEDPEMRHGRKSKSKRFNGYKEHVAVDLDTSLILACEVTPANQPEEQATVRLQEDLVRHGKRIGELYIDRGYINSSQVDRVIEDGGEIFCKPWKLRNANADLYSKADFLINMRSKTITCPTGQTESFEPGQVVEFDPEVCGACPFRDSCTHAASGKGRTVRIGHDERLQHKLR